MTYTLDLWVGVSLGNMGILTHGKPSNRERGSAHKCITDG